MRALVRAELVKLHSTRTPIWLLSATLVLMVVAILVNVPTGAAGSQWSIHDPALLARITADTFGVPEVTMTILGLLAITQEFRYGTITSTLLVEPRRQRVLAAKGIALVLESVLVTAAALAVALTTAAIALHAHHGTVVWNAELAEVVAALFVVTALYGIVGLAIGALVRNQIVAVVVTLVWMMFVERLLVEALPAIGRWALAGATNAFVQLGPAPGTTEPLLSAPVGGLVVLLYTAVLGGLALVVVPRRDVTG